MPGDPNPSDSDPPRGESPPLRSPDPDRFVVAANPDSESSLPYLLHLPLEGGVMLKARDIWPSGAKVYCHPLEAWPEGAEVIEEVDAVMCRRRGAAIDLVLERRSRKRSQFVMTKPHPGRHGGREMIFWQTRQTTRKTRPGSRLPTARPKVDGIPSILVDTRERMPYRFTRREVVKEVRQLDAGDYAVARGEEVVAAVERKTEDQFVTDLTQGALTFQMQALETLPAAAVVVEGTYSALLRNEHVTPGWIANMVAATQVRFRGVPIVFLQNRKFAEEWTFRFLSAAAAAELGADCVAREASAEDEA